MKKLIWLFLLFSLPLFASDKTRFELRDGDRVAFIGGVFAEREQDDGYIETMLTMAFPNCDVTFRNFGWAGDTVESHLGNPPNSARPKYVPSLFDYVAKFKPTVLFVSYGMMESFRGESGLSDFEKNYNALLDRLSTNGTRIVLITPFQHEKIGGLFPDPVAHNEKLGFYVAATEKIARGRGFTFVDLFHDLPVAPKSKRPLTSNGVHLNSYGYQQAAVAVQKSLGLNRWVSFPKKEHQIAETLRPLIQHKNKQWWFHYRPMNSEYVYPGGTRYQNELGGVKHPMFSEIEAFAALAEKEDREIFAVRKTLSGTGIFSVRTETHRRNAHAITKAEQRAADILSEQKTENPDPETERKTFQVADGFEVNLFAADPLISKPTQIAFDAKGRLWVATTTLYPQIQPGENSSDKIIILEDTNNDGVTDKTTIFADDLLIPTGILPYRDGAFVSDDTKILFLRDTDGDGRADTRETVLAGFGTEDSHHKAHVLRWGPDGRMYFNVGVFLHNNIETAHGLFSQAGYWQPGVLAFDPATGKLDSHLATSVPPNPWGHYWNRWGFDFHIDSSGQQGSNFILPTANRSSTAIPVPGGQGKLAGGEILSGRHLPDEWQGNLIAAPFKENRVARWSFSEDGSGYALAAQPSIIVSTDTSFRPVDERMGPDGAIYIADWYNPLIGHMQHHFRDPGRDHTHGRIWRVTAKKRPLVPKPDFSVSTKKILDYLKTPEDFTRSQAKRVLAERNPKEVSAALAAWVKNLNPSDAEYDHHRVEALWAFQTIHVVAPELLRDLLRAKNPNARAAATAVLRDWHDKIENPLSLLEQMAADESPRVRLQAVISASYIPEKRAMEVAAKVLDFPMDAYLDQALKNTAIALKNFWEPALVASEPMFGGDGKKLQFVLQAAGTQANPKSLIALLKLNQIAESNFDQTVESIAQNGDKEDLVSLFRVNWPGAQQSKILNALAKSSRERKLKIVLSAESNKRIEAWLAGSDEPLKAAAIRLAGAWNGAAFLERFIQMANDKNAPQTIRLAAIQAVSWLGKNETRDSKGHNSASLALIHLGAVETNPVIRDAAIAALAEIDLVNAADRVVSLLCKEPKSPEEIAKLLNIILSRKNGAEHMASIIEVNGDALPKLNADSAKLALRAMQIQGRSSGGSNERLAKFLSDAAGIDAGEKELSHDELQQLAAEVRSKGDPFRGEKIFRRADLNCFQCHALNGVGSGFAPDLGAVGSGSQIGYLIESVLAPNKIIKDGFETMEVLTKDGESTLGIKVRETPQELVLKDAARSEIRIPQNLIRDKSHSQTSLMPPGLTAGLTHGEFLDLIRFLSELGRPGPFANDTKPVMRKWEVISPAPAEISDAKNLQWSPVYALVSGVLPLDAIFAEKQGSALIRSRISVAAQGVINLKFNSVSGLKLFVNEKPIELRENLVLEFERGEHTLMLKVDSQRSEGLRLELGGNAVPIH